MWRPGPAWVENQFTNGYYPHVQFFWASLTSAVPFSLNDAVVGLGVLALAAALIFVRPFWRALLGVLAIAGFYSFWFYAGWGFGYDRAPIETRAAFDPSLLTAARVNALRRRAIAQMNALAPLAHAEDAHGHANNATLQSSWAAVAQRLGDRWQPRVGPAKPTIGGFIMDLNGTTGFTSPFTLETHLAPDRLWFETPFTQAHEWSHVAGYNREDEANYIAALACLRDRDPAVRYSGWLEVFLYLPSQQKYPRRTFVTQVWQDFAAIRKRNAHFVNLNFSRFSWHVYNSYLKSNHIAAGVQNYDQVTRLLAGIPLDAHGLPVMRAL